jgi:hypothetical protein
MDSGGRTCRSVALDGPRYSYVHVIKGAKVQNISYRNIKVRRLLKLEISRNSHILHYRNMLIAIQGVLLTREV